MSLPAKRAEEEREDVLPADANPRVERAHGKPPRPARKATKKGTRKDPERRGGRKIEREHADSKARKDPPDREGSETRQPPTMYAPLIKEFPQSNRDISPRSRKEVPRGSAASSAGIPESPADEAVAFKTDASTTSTGSTGERTHRLPATHAFAAPPRVGRPTKLTPELIDKIEVYIRAGATPGNAAGLVGVTRSTFNEWLRRGRDPQRTKRGVVVAEDRLYVEFSDRVEVALGHYGASLESTANKLSRAGNDKMVRFLLQTRFANEYGPRQRVAVEGGEGGPVQFEHGLSRAAGVLLEQLFPDAKESG